MNIAQHIERSCRFFPVKPALIFEGNSLTYKQLNELANRVANGLKGLGIKRGERVALFLPNIPEFVTSYLGILKIGAVAVSLSAMLKKDEVRFILSDCEAVAIITTEALREQVPDEDLAYLKHIVIAEGNATRSISLESLIASASTDAEAVAMEPSEPAAILYTSGTTGFPKGATLSHGNVVSNMHSVKHCCGMRAEDRLLLYLPLFHCFGQNFILNSGLNACATIVLQRRFLPEETLRVASCDRVTMFFGVPTVFAKLLEMQLDECDLSSVRYYFSAAAKLSVDIVKQWQEHYGAIIHEGYGLTETSPFACYNHYLKYKAGSVGMPIDNVEMKVVNEAGEEVALGEIGEIVVRGPNVMSGYWNRPDETTKVLSKGWFRTGDLGRMDEDGYFYLVDRLKDMINVSGFKVYPAEVERIIASHPAVAESAVYGVPDKLKGEIVRANVRLKPNQVLTEAEMMAFCSKVLAAYKVPQAISFVDSLPKNATGKVLKRVLREAHSRPPILSPSSVLGSP